MLLQTVCAAAPLKQRLPKGLRVFIKVSNSVPRHTALPAPGVPYPYLWLNSAASAIVLLRCIPDKSRFPPPVLCALVRRTTGINAAGELCIPLTCPVYKRVAHTLLCDGCMRKSPTK